MLNGNSISPFDLPPPPLHSTIVETSNCDNSSTQSYLQIKPHHIVCPAWPGKRNLEQFLTQPKPKEPATRLACGRMHYSRPGPTLVGHNRLSPVKILMDGSRRRSLLELVISELLELSKPSVPTRIGRKEQIPRPGAAERIHTCLLI